ncbi:MAG: hypothetical protein B7Y77_02255 [Bradyrhizobium sp. 35-63-5]|nr:MAG: hypothetical protein B7Y77_02255 [Bradyrhizobium sp. 35-63-5]
MPQVSTKSLKQRTGLSLLTIRKALKSAGVQADSVGSVDEAAALAAIAANVDPARTAGHAVGGKGDVAEASGAATRGKLGTLADAKARSEIARADKLEIENRRRAGELVERAAVERAGVALFTQTRIALLAIASKVAPRLLGITDALDAQRIVDEAIREALAAFAEDQQALAEILA